MRYKNFLLRAVNLLLVLGVLWQYQQVALVRAAAVSQRRQEIAEVEAYNASVLQAQSEAQAEQTHNGYRDGTYEGSAFGFDDAVWVLSGLVQIPEEHKTPRNFCTLCRILQRNVSSAHFETVHLLSDKQNRPIPYRLDGIGLSGRKFKPVI